MLHNYLISAKPWQQLFVKLLIYFISAVAVLGFLLCIAAFIIIRIDTPEYVLIPLTTVLLTLSSFLNSFLAGKTLKENGRYIGAATGTVFTAIIVCVSVYYNTFSITNLFLTKVAAVMFAGILGGILGVNS